MNPLSRRHVLGGLAASALLARGPVAIAQSVPRVASIDWALLETCIAIGAVPVAATELIQFRAIAVEPAVPADVADLGLRGTPSYEMLRTVAPDLILISGFYEYQRAALERIAPVEAYPIYQAGTPPFAIVEATTRALGGRLGRADAAQTFIAETRAQLEADRAALADFARNPAYLISLGDTRHFRAFGGDSMMGDVLARLGIGNAWTDDTSYSAAAPVGVEALARSPDASIVIVGPLPAQVGLSLPDNALWQALPAVRNSRVVVLDPVNHFGGLPSARRFSRLLAEAVQKQANG